MMRLTNPNPVRAGEQVAEAPGFGWNVRGTFHLFTVEARPSTNEALAWGNPPFDKLRANGILCD